jgi:hypothetical protein
MLSKNKGKTININNSDVTAVMEKIGQHIDDVKVHSIANDKKKNSKKDNVEPIIAVANGSENDAEEMTTQRTTVLKLSTMQRLQKVKKLTGATYNWQINTAVDLWLNQNYPNIS